MKHSLIVDDAFSYRPNLFWRSTNEHCSLKNNLYSKIIKVQMYTKCIMVSETFSESRRYIFWQASSFFGVDRMLPVILILMMLVSSSVRATHLSYRIEDYTTLSESLLANYSNKIRPIRDLGQSLQMEASLWIISINEVSDAEQKMSTTGYLHVKWKDAMITWDSATTGIYWIQFNQVIPFSVTIYLYLSIHSSQ